MKLHYVGKRGLCSDSSCRSPSPALRQHHVPCFACLGSWVVPDRPEDRRGALGAVGASSLVPSARAEQGQEQGMQQGGTRRPAQRSEKNHTEPFVSPHIYKSRFLLSSPTVCISNSCKKRQKQSENHSRKFLLPTR